MHMNKYMHLVIKMQSTAYLCRVSLLRGRLV